MSVLYERFAGSSPAFLVIFLVMFLGIVGGALLLTPKLARWVDESRAKKPGFYDGMLEEDPSLQQMTAEEAEDTECSK